MKKATILAILVLAITVLGCPPPPEGGSYSIIYHGNENTSGYPPTDSNKYSTGMEAIVLDQGTLLKTGHEFSHWNTKADGTGEEYNEDETITVGYITIFLYAIWIPD